MKNCGVAVRRLIPPLSLRDISPRGEHPSVKPYGLPAPLSGEPLLTPLQILKESLFIASSERGGGPPKAVEGLIPERWGGVV